MVINLTYKFVYKLSINTYLVTIWALLISKMQLNSLYIVHPNMYMYMYIDKYCIIIKITSIGIESRPKT